MARFFYNLYNGLGDTTDHEGRETADVAEARAVCIDSIRSIVAEECMRGLIDLTGRIEVIDEAQAPVITVTYCEAFDLKLPPS